MKREVSNGAPHQDSVKSSVLEIAMQQDGKKYEKLGDNNVHAASKALDIINATINEKCLAMLRMSGNSLDLFFQMSKLTGTLLKTLPNAVYKIKCKFNLDDQVDFHSTSLKWFSKVIETLFARYEMLVGEEKIPFETMQALLGHILNFWDQSDALLGMMPKESEEVFFSIIEKHFLPWLVDQLKGSYRLALILRDCQYNCNSSEKQAIILQKLIPAVTMLLDWTLVFSATGTLSVFELEIVPELNEMLHLFLSTSDLCGSIELLKATFSMIEARSAILRHALYASPLSSFICRFLCAVLHATFSSSLSVEDIFVQFTAGFLLSLRTEVRYHAYSGNWTSSEYQKDRKSLSKKLTTLHGELRNSIMHVLCNPELSIAVLRDMESLDCRAHTDSSLLLGFHIKKYKTFLDALEIEDVTLILQESLLPSFLTMLWSKRSKIHIQLMLRVFLNIRKTLICRHSSQLDRFYISALKEVKLCGEIMSYHDEAEIYSHGDLFAIFKMVQAEEKEPKLSSTQEISGKINAIIAKSRPLDIIYTAAEKFGYFVHRTGATQDGIRIFMIGDIMLYITGYAVFWKRPLESHFEAVGLLKLFQSLARAEVVA